MSTGFPSSSLREMESLAFSERVTGIEQKPGSLVNYEALMMHQARKQRTPNTAVRCYNAFSGVLEKREYIQQMPFLVQKTDLCRRILALETHWSSRKPCENEKSRRQHCGSLEAAMLGGLPCPALECTNRK